MNVKSWAMMKTLMKTLIITVGRRIRSFLFQAEDGIRDPLWSRELGDVYKSHSQLTAVQRAEKLFYMVLT